MKKLFFAVLIAATLAGCTANKTHTHPCGGGYDWELNPGVEPDENGECWPYSRMGDDGRCYPI